MGVVEFVEFFLFVSGRAEMLSRTGLFVRTYMLTCVFVRICVCVCVYECGCDCVVPEVGEGLWLLLRDGILMLLCL